MDVLLQNPTNIFLKQPIRAMLNWMGLVLFLRSSKLNKLMEVTKDQQSMFILSFANFTSETSFCNLRGDPYSQHKNYIIEARTHDDL